MKYKLNIEVDFSDKYTDEKYKIGDVVTFKEARAKELLADSRGLVSLNEIVENKDETKEKGKGKGKKEEVVEPPVDPTTDDKGDDEPPVDPTTDKK